MAETEIEILIKWENNVSFEVTAKENDGPTLTIVKADENGQITILWPALTDVMERYIKAIMARIGQEMSKA